jgi:hypothetical protein
MSVISNEDAEEKYFIGNFNVNNDEIFSIANF